MKIISFDTLPSTNDFLMELSKKDANSWTVIYAKEQTQGKGYAGNQWQVKANENLTFSLLIKSDLSYAELIYLNQWVARSIQRVLVKYLGHVCIKWPNDIILNDKKVCGVLIENYKHQQQMNSVIGIGLNVNQTDFNQLPNATSMALETAKTYDIMTILTNLVDELKNSYSLLENRQFEQISLEYNQFLYRRDILSTFKIQDEVKKGIIRKATNQGTLIVEFDGIEQEFLHKQIELIF